MLNRLTVAILMTALSILPIKAQIRGGAATPGTTGMGIRPVTTGTGGTHFPGRGVVVGSPNRFQHRRSFDRGSVFLPYPYFYSDYGYDYAEAPPQVTVVPPAPAVESQTTPSTPLEPLLIEWQGDRFVRMTLSQKASPSGQTAPDYSEKSALRSPVPARKGVAQAPRELPPAVFVFRDGRTEEASSYIIMNGIIYTKADYWSSGSWTTQIQVADLDVPATLKLNQERGLKFVLPAGPNEVVTRP